MHRDLGLIKGKITTAKKELAQSLKRHERKDTWLHTQINKIVTARKAIALAEHEADLLAFLAEKARTKNETRLALKYEIEAAYKLQQMEKLKQEETQLAKIIKFETGQEAIEQKKPTGPFEKMQRKLDALRIEVEEAANELSKIEKLVGPTHPQTKLTRLNLARTNANYFETSWKLKLAQLKKATDIKEIKRLKTALAHAEDSVKLYGKRAQKISRELQQRE